MMTHLFEFSVMASRCSIRLAGIDETTAQRWADQAISEVRRIEVKYSRYRADSMVSRLNAAAGQAARVEVDEETAGLIGFAGELHRASSGMFDITSGVLRRAWDFRSGRLPSQAQIESLLPLVGWEQVEWDGLALRLPQAGMELDFGGFGKEYAADRAASLLQGLGATSGMRQVEASDRTNGMRGFGDRFHVERLTGVEVDPTETDEGQFIAEFVDLRKDVLCSEQMFPYTWLHFNEIDIRVSTVEGDL